MQDGKSLVKNVSLDVDGGYALRPFKAQCSLSRDQDSELITTTVFHDLEPSGMFVTGPTDPGTIRKTLRYGLHIDQIDRFIDGFESCEQVGFMALFIAYAYPPCLDKQLAHTALCNTFELFQAAKLVLECHHLSSPEYEQYTRRERVHVLKIICVNYS